MSRPTKKDLDALIANRTEIVNSLAPAIPRDFDTLAALFTRTDDLKGGARQTFIQPSRQRI